MKILGIKSSHDGALALIDNGKLIFSYEMEKLNNNFRLADFNLTFEEIESILNKYNYSFSTLDHVAIDGWRNDKEEVLKLEQEDEITILKDLELSKDFFIDLKLAKYGALLSETDDVLKVCNAKIDALNLSYSSYMHVSGHIFSAYCTSPYTKNNEDSYILSWDGGMVPQLFYYEAKDKKVINCGPVFLMFGGVYPDFAYEFTPFSEKRKDHSISGKLMAYIALGNKNEELLQHYFRIYNDLEANVKSEINIKNVNWVTEQFKIQSKEICISMGLSSEDVLCTFHIFLENLLIEKLKVLVDKFPYSKSNFCFVGGCALSIKWNSKLRNSGIFDTMWVPPFPNDSGSAIGVACCVMMDKTDTTILDWNVYSGPGIIENIEENDMYLSKSFSVKALAALLHEKDEPVVVLNGRAELGPRSLGNRSIISPATNQKMKGLLNKVKGREFYRPVAPICLEDDAPNVFFPGNPDPFMLFEHTVREDWDNRVPAIVHLDGSARLQTVNENENNVIYELLSEYKKLSGIPLLCNTSANFNGKGFFPDLKSVMEWESVNYFWCNNKLYERKEKMDLYENL